MSQAGYFQFARPFAHAGGTISGVRAFAPASQNAFTGFFSSTPELPREWVDTLRQLHPDIRGPLSSALQTLKNQNVEVQLSPVRATANDTLAADRLAFSAAGTTPEANAAITKALTDQGLVAGHTTGRFQSNPDSEVPAIAALPSIRGRDGLSYRVIPGGTVWERSAGAPQFAQAVQTHLAERFGNTQATPGRVIALSALPESSTTTSPSPQASAPAAAQTQPARPLIVLDPGHGVYRSVNPHTGAMVSRGPAGDGIITDSGAVHRATGTTEAQINDAMSARIALSMRNRNYDVQLTRRIDVNSPMLRDVSAADRAYLSQLNQSAPELLPDRFNARIETGAGRKVLHLSVHANAADAPTARGVEFYTHTTHQPGDASNTYAAQLRQEFQGAGLLNTQQHLTSLNTGIISPGPYDGVREALRNNGSADRHVVRGLGTGVAAAVAELGYVTNPQDFARLTSPQGQQQLADLVANATDRFQQSRGHTMSTGQQRTTPAASPAAPARQPQTPQQPPFDIRGNDPRVAETTARLQAWNQSLPEGRRNDTLASADMAQPQNRFNLLMHFKRDQNATENRGFALTDPTQQHMVGPKVTAAIAALPAASPAAGTAPQPPAQSTPPAAQPSAPQPPQAPQPAAPSAATAPTAAPLPPVRPSRPSADGLVAKPTGRTTPEQRAERHTENGLRVLGITREGMSAEDRAAALKHYAAGAGLPEGATPAQIREQVGKDIRALQERLRDANTADASKGRYDLGRFGQNGVDGIAGAYTQGALQRYIQDNPGQTALALIRPNSAVAATPAQGTTPPSTPAATTPAPSAASTTTPATPPAGTTTPPAAPSTAVTPAAVTPSAAPAPEPTEAQRQSAAITIGMAQAPILPRNPLLDLRQSPPIDPASIIAGPTEPSMEDRLRAARAAAGPSHDEFLRAFNLAPTPAAPPAATPSAAAPADGVTRQGIQDALRIPPEHRSQAPAPAAAPIRTDALPPEVLNQAAAVTTGSQRFDVAQAETIGNSNAPNGKPHQPDKSTAIG